jgi:hypothetical protein
MPKCQQNHRFWHWWIGTLIMGIIVSSSLACKESIPTEGVFPIKVIVLTNDKLGIPNVSVQINDKEIGKTDKYGTFVGTHKGQVDGYVQIKVVGAGVNNYFDIKKPLRMRKTQSGWIPSEIKVEAFLRPATLGDGDSVVGAGGSDLSDTELLSDDYETDKPKETTGSSKKHVASLTPTPPRPDPPAIEPKSTTPDPPAIEPKSTTPDPPAIEPKSTTPDPPAIEPPKPQPSSGKYAVEIRSNAPGVRVTCRGCRQKSLGVIRDANGKIEYNHIDRRSNPRPLTFTFDVLGTGRFAYTNSKITRQLTIEPGREQYEIDASFEQRPPIKINVRANLAGISVLVNGKIQGEIQSPDQPLVIEHTDYRAKTLRVELRPTNRRVKPQNIRRVIRLRPNTNSYDVQGSFTEPPEPRPDPPVAVAPPPVDPPPSTSDNPTPVAPPPRREYQDNPPLPGFGSSDRGLDNPSEIKQPDPPVTPTPSAGSYIIKITSNANNIAVFSGKRRIGIITDAPLIYTHKDKSPNPKPLALSFRPSNPYAYTQRELTRTLPIEAGRENYHLEIDFEKRPPLRVMAKANVQGVQVKVNGKSIGVVQAPEQPVVLEYSGKPLRKVNVEFLSPNPNLYQPRSIKRTLDIEEGRSQYEVAVSFEEFDPGDKVVLKPRCFQKKSGKYRTIILKAKPQTRFVLKGECDEPLASTGKSGQIKVSMPTGTWQRVWAFAGAVKTQKVFEVTPETEPMMINFAISSRACELKLIQKKIINRVPLEEEEVDCLKKIAQGNPQYFSSQLFLARFYCQQRMHKHGFTILQNLGKDPRNQFEPYNSLQLGMEFGRCRKYDEATKFLRYSEQRITRFAPADRYENSKALYRAMATIYEQRYYRTKNTVDLTRTLRSLEMLMNIIQPTEQSERNQTQKELERIKKMLAEKGGLDD